ncbi:MAG: SH3 domain-containing protein [Anaerolineae bacterium]|nr:SH3 domain-containing protein [Anaerolineae bacterium]
MSIKRLLIVGMFILMLGADPVLAATFIIPPGDTPALIAAINAANDEATNPGLDTIELSPNSLYLIPPMNPNTANGLPTITSPIAVQGNGATIRGMQTVYTQAIHFFIIAANGNLSIDWLQITGGYMHGTLMDLGGAIQNSGTLTITNSILRGNGAEDSGGALWNQGGGVATFTNSTLASNGQSAIYNGGTLNFINSTIASNGGAYGNLYGGIYNAGGTITFANTIINQNTTQNCRGAGTITSLGNNVDSDNSCGLNAPTDQVGIDSLLGTLADNGGSTLTYALLPGSPALDAANPARCPATDQRGIARPVDGNNDGTAICDIGALEVNGSESILPTFTLTFAPNPVQVGVTVLMTYTIINHMPATNLTGLYFYHVLPNQFVIAPQPAPANTCGGTLNADYSVQLFGGTLAANAICTITVPITVSQIGQYPTATYPLGADQFAPYQSAQGTLAVVDQTTINPEQPIEAIPLCGDLNGFVDPVLRAEIPSGIYGVYCRIITNSPATIGNAEVLAQGVLQAVDVFSTNYADANGSVICLQGSGSILFLNSAGAPRVPQILASYPFNDFTCTVIPHTGVVVLVNQNLTSVQSASQSFANCRVTTTHAVHLRAEPNANSMTITTLPYDLTLTATERLGQWIRVIYLDGQGWVNDTYLAVNQEC